MKKTISTLFALQLALAVGMRGQELAPNAPKDKPIGATAETVSRFEKAVAPYIAEGQRTYPEARKRYLAGLPPKHVFAVMLRLSDDAGRFELVFIWVRKIDVEKREIQGKIANHIDVVHGYHQGQTLTLPESRVLDWTISKPDGTEEGNVVGKFLDEYQEK
jgi:uncharacterized protein YegJ (DUF2314 family)